MQASESDNFTNVLIDLIGTEDEGEEKTDQGTFSVLEPSINSALVVAQSSARPAATVGFSSSSSASSSIRDRSGRFDFDRIREELSRASTPKSHSDVSTLSWTRSNNTQGEGGRSTSGGMHSVGMLGSDLSQPILSRTPSSLGTLSQSNSDRVVANPNPRDDQTLTLLSPLKLDHPPLLGDSVSSVPPQTPTAPEPAQRPAEPSTLPTWQNMTELFDLMQSQMTALTRALELARADSVALRKRCLDLESRLGIQSDAPALPTAERVMSPGRPHRQRLDDVRAMTPPNDLHTDRPKPATMDSALTFIRNIDELVWRRTLFANSPTELAALASLPDFVRNNDDVLASANLAALEERIRLWESIVRRTSD
ncbi:hypothetical protein FS749_007777 [Ceratobasidium sp. UAMH 11750]|nr:hypothetical protein FS749_007777 [Ceratobasidium sp. UAMH 11750]